MCGGAGVLLVNLAFDPFLPRHVSYAEVAASSIHLWRSTASSICAAMLLFGSVGLYLCQAERAGGVGACAFAVAFLGSALLLGNEWTQIFDVRDFARRAPDALNALNAAHGPTLSDIGAIIVLSTFSLGWIGLAISTWRTHPANRGAAWLVTAGFFAIPLLNALFAAPWDAILGNAILGAGFAWLGYNTVKNARAKP
jgi:hypothetical protein